MTQKALIGICFFDAPRSKGLGRNEPKRIITIHRQGNGAGAGPPRGIRPADESGLIFNFCMGKNTTERKDYIMDRLVVPVEE